MLSAIPLGLNEIISSLGLTMGIGIGGRGFTKLEEEYQNDTEKQREKEFYLFWRLLKTQKEE